MSIHAEILASFYGAHREWSLPELDAAKALESQHGWTPSRAFFIATWIEGKAAGRFWKGSLTKRDGILAVLKSVAQITDQSGVDAEAPTRPGWQAYIPGYGTDPATAEPLGKSFEAKVAAAQKPWWDLIEEAKALGLSGMAATRWVFAERAKRTGRAPVNADGMLSSIGRPVPAVKRASPKHWQEAKDE